MHTYSRFQRFLSFILIFSLFFSFSFNLSFLNLLGTIFAADLKTYNLVSIYVQDEIYNGVRASVNTYANNIQAALENTKTIIIPIPGDTHPFNIASLNEKLYQEGYKGVDLGEGNSKLIGSVFIGDLALPVVENAGSYEKTVLPYVDFDDKLYVYSEDDRVFHATTDVIQAPKAEIWHGFIAPNTGNYQEDIREINQYFQKNEDFYNGEGEFQNAKRMMNGNQSQDLLDDYEPHVFYYDQIRESQAVKYVEYKAYEAYLANVEDLMYNRYTSELAEKLKQSYFDAQGRYIGDLSAIFGSGTNIGDVLGGPTTQITPDVQNRQIIEGSVRRFLQIFTAGGLGEMRTNVHNAGRYNSGSNVVNADLMPYLISAMDTFSQNVIKNVNNDLENEIDELVANGLSRKVPVLMGVGDNDYGKAGNNFFYGLEGSKVTSAEQCSIYRGSNSNSGQLIEANRGYNVNNTESDLALCPKGQTSGYWGGNSPLNLKTEAITNWEWTLKNADPKKAVVPVYDIQGGIYKSGSLVPSTKDCLVNNIIPGSDKVSCGSKNNNYNYPLDFDGTYVNFDTISNKKCQDTSLTLDGKTIKSASVGGCPEEISYDENGNQVTIKTPPKKVTYGYKTIPGYLMHKAPNSTQLYSQTQYMISPNLPVDKDRYIDFMGPTGVNYSIYYPQIFRASTSSGTLTFTGAHDILKQYLDASSVHINQVISRLNTDVDDVWKDEAGCPKPYAIPPMKYLVKYINPSPWKSKIRNEEILTKIPTRLPAKLEKVRMYFILKPDQRYAEKLTEYGEIQPLQEQAPTATNECGVKDKEPDEILVAPTFRGIPHIWKYFMNAEVNLYEFIKVKPVKEFDLFGDKIDMNYLDTLTFAIYWQNLNNVSAKYKFIFENYLSDQFGGNDFSFYLPKNKKQYEISYLGAPGDPQNMYIKLDPEDKGENPYDAIIKANQTLNSHLFTVKDTGYDDGMYNCAPPEGVAIWQWFPAVTCRLEDMLPPKIKVNQGSCGLNTMNILDDYFGEEYGYDDDYYCADCEGRYDYDSTPTIDDNKNGLPDVLEDAVEDGQLLLRTDTGKYHYNKYGFAEAKLVDQNGNTITYDSNSEIDFELVKLEIPKDETKSFDASNTKTVYDMRNTNYNTQATRQEADKYINVKDLTVKLNRGQIRYNFSSKNTEANITLRATLKLRDYADEVVVQKVQEVQFQIRGDLFYGVNYKLATVGNELFLDTLNEGIVALNSQNVFLTDETYFSALKTNLASLNNLSTSTEKLFISLANKDKLGKVLNVQYPVSVKIFNEQGTQVGNTLSVTNANTPLGIGTFQDSGVYLLQIEDKQGFTIKKQLTILPDVAIKIDPKLSTNLMEKGGVLTTHVFSIYDKYDNPAVGQVYTIEANISGNSVVFEDGTNSKIFQIYDGYRAFRLKSTPMTGTSRITFQLKVGNKVVDTKTVSMNVVDKIEFDLIGIPNELSVGNKNYNYTLRVKNQTNAGSFNSRGYLVTKSIYVQSMTNQINIVNGTGTGTLQTKTKAGEKVQLEFKIEGVKESVYKEVNIVPDVALKVDLTLSKSKIEADFDSTSQLYAEIKDRYGNIIWNDNSTQLNVEVLPQYRHIISVSNQASRVIKGKATFTFQATDIPGTAYFKISSNPSLANNKVQLVGQTPFIKNVLDELPGFREGGILTSLGRKFFTDYDLENYRFKYITKESLQASTDFKALSGDIQNTLLQFFEQTNTLVVQGVGENVGKIETFYFWNKEKIDGKKYNGLYSTLLGTNYGDLTVKDNLANSIIFDPTNKALGVTTLLSDPTKHQEVLNIHPDGNLKFNYSYNDISQDFTSYFNINNNGALEVSMQNNTFDNLIAKVYYNIKNPLLLDSCAFSDITKCYDEEQTTLILKATQSKYISKSDERTGLKFINPEGQTLLEISKSGIFTKNNSLSIELSKSYTEAGVFDLKINNQIVGQLFIHFPKKQIQITRDTALVSQLISRQAQGGMVVYVEGRDYFYKQTYLGSSTKDEVGYIISYNDPFASSAKTVNHFSHYFDFGYENFYENEGLGWKEDNKILLSFAAGKTLGEATKDFMSFSLINIGDPVISLKPIYKKLPGTQKTRKYDSTIGELVSQDEKNIAYDVFDYNNDGNEDVAILKRGGYVELLEGTAIFGDFLNRGNLLYVADMSTSYEFITGDFFGDGYDDIVVLNKDRQVVVYSNTQKNFTRIETNISFKGKLNQIIGFDMDLDGKKDVVILDDLGDLYIFYGTSTVGRFDKKLVDSGLGLVLNTEVRKDEGALYYDGLYQIPVDKTTQNVLDSDSLSQQVLQNTAQLSGSLLTSETTESNQYGVNEAILDKIVFTQMNYTPPYIQEEEQGMYEQMPFPVLTDTMQTGLEAQQKSVDDIVQTFSGTTSTSALDLSDGILGIEQGIQNTLTGVQNLFSQYANDSQATVSSTGEQLSNYLTTFIRSEYSEYQGIKIEKQYTDLNGNPLRGGDNVRLNIKITNNTSRYINDIAYADKIHKMFSFDKESSYSLRVGTDIIPKEDIIFKSSPTGEYDFIIDSYYWNDEKEYIYLAPGESMELTLTLKTNAFQYGFIEVGFFDDQTAHGDIIFKEKDENCGQEVEMYKSIASRSYLRDRHMPMCENQLPEGMEENSIDENGNGIPDYIDRLLSGEDDFTEYADEKLAEVNKDSDYDGIPDIDDMAPWYDDTEEDFMNSLDLVDISVDEILYGMDTVLAGLSCGFGGGSCISAPLNWAPLASGQDPTLFGMPMLDGLNIAEGLPVFSAINWMKVGSRCVPSAWPPALNMPGCYGSGAGGRLGTYSPTNFLRVFVTPTLTGSIGIAICFGAPAFLAGQSNPMGFHPLVPGGNCVVAAVPLLGCEDDGSDGEIYNRGNPNATIINGNCTSNAQSKRQKPYLGEKASQFIQYRNTGYRSDTYYEDIGDLLSTVATGPAQEWDLPNRPLLNVGDGENPDLDIDLDFSGVMDGNFEDVVDIQMTRISPFPDFVMEWVTRQIEEIANKLTDFPTLYIILPEFDAIFDKDWGSFIDDLQSSYARGEQEAQETQGLIQQQIDSEKEYGAQIDCEQDGIGCLSSELEVSKLEAVKNLSANKSLGGIKAAYEFLSNMPMVKIEPEKVNFNIPWIDRSTIDKAIADFEATKLQWLEEIEKAKENWDIENYNCIGTPESQEYIGCKIILDAQAMIDSIDENIEILRSYKEIPSDVFKMVKIKEVRMEQILCNLEVISSLLANRIGENGERFKAWVELYVLIKAILKSWQLLVDVFIDYDAECHECKNERYDLLYFIWKLISMILPKIPVIQFPKWPDIYLDLHNVRAGLIIGVPEFEFNIRPIILPALPELYLPESPNVNIHLPMLPLLPEFELPRLPELPSLPEVELPNLPPPPKLPRLLAVIEAYLNILKLITKAMCILKTSPFVPEWRAGDQIAFITERTGYLDIDFLDVSLPQFSFPFVDALKVTTYVNLEFETEFLVEMARQTALPINVFTNDIVNMLNIGLGDIDFRDTVPQDIDVDVELDGVNVDTSFVPDVSNGKINLFDLATVFALGITKLHKGIEDNSKIILSNEEFKSEIAGQLPNIKNEKIVGVWNNALQYSFSKEDAFIQELLEKNTSKYDELKSIIQEEKQKNTELLLELQEKLASPVPEKTDVLVLADEAKSVTDYNTRLEVYNQYAKKSIENLFIPDQETKELQDQGKQILAQVNQGLQGFSKKMDESSVALDSLTQTYKNLMVANIPSSTSPSPNSPSTSSTSTDTSGPDTVIQSTTATPVSQQACSLSQMNGYNYIYKGIYIIETFLNRKISYRLFDYLDELKGDEVSKEVDIDRDGDQDIIYMVGTDIYLKQNYISKKSPRDYYTGNPLVLSKGNNVFLDGEFIQAVDGLKETASDSNYINVRFNATDKQTNYRLEFFQIVDKFDDMVAGYVGTYIPTQIKKYMIDSFADIDNLTMNIETVQDTNFVTRNNLAYITNISNLNGVKLSAKKPINIAEDIAKNREVTINAGTKIYAGDENVRLIYYFYKDRNNEVKNKEVRLNSLTNIQFKEDIIVIGVVGNAYVESEYFETFSGNQIANFVKKPLLPGSRIEYIGNTTTPASTYITIQYYDGSEALLDFSEITYYELQDLGMKFSHYLLRTQLDNDFYYAKMRSFSNNMFSTYSKQILLAPQKESDVQSPEIGNFSTIKVPVYQQKTVDISQYIFENSGNNKIADIYVDFDLTRDSDADANLTNDSDVSLKRPTTNFKIVKEGTRILLQVGAFTQLYDRQIKLFVEDENGNIGAKTLRFMVYAPTPQIQSFTNDNIGGVLDEALANEPISFYRIRNQQVTKLQDVSNRTTTYSVEGGKFLFDTRSTSTRGAEVTYSGSTLFTLDEETGKIELNDIAKITQKLDIKVTPSNSSLNQDVYPKIEVTQNGIPIYSQYLVTPNVGKVEVVSEFNQVLGGAYQSKKGVYYMPQLSDTFQVVSLPLGITQNAGDLYVYSSSDPNKTPLFRVYKDGRVETVGDLYYLEYGYYGKYVVYNLKRRGLESPIGKVLIIPEGNFIVK